MLAKISEKFRKVDENFAGVPNVNHPSYTNTTAIFCLESTLYTLFYAEEKKHWLRSSAPVPSRNENFVMLFHTCL